MSAEGLILTYDGTLEGLFTAVLESYRIREDVIGIEDRRLHQENLLAASRFVETRMEDAVRVRDGLCRRLGSDEYERIRVTSLADESDTGTIIYRYIVFAMRTGRGAWNVVSNPAVERFEELWRSVYNERHRILQFARFSRMQNGVYLAKVNPKANVVPVCMEHFAGRFNTQPFIIYDEVHHIAGVWDMHSWTLVESDDIHIPEPTEDEREYEHLWRTFYDTIENERRHNPRLRMQFMPKRLWRNITEMQEETDGTGGRADRNLPRGRDLQRELH